MLRETSPIETLVLLSDELLQSELTVVTVVSNSRVTILGRDPIPSYSVFNPRASSSDFSSKTMLSWTIVSLTSFNWNLPISRRNLSKIWFNWSRRNLRAFAVVSDPVNCIHSSTRMLKRTLGALSGDAISFRRSIAWPATIARQKSDTIVQFSISIESLVSRIFLSNVTQLMVDVLKLVVNSEVSEWYLTFSVLNRISSPLILAMLG